MFRISGEINYGRSVGISPDQVKFDQIITGIDLKFEDDIDEVREKAEHQICEIDRILSSSAFNDINNHIQRYKNEKRMDYEPSWYSPLGSSVRKVAIDVGRLPEYYFFYSLTSEVMHSSRYSHHMIFKGGRLIFEPIRSLNGIKTLINFIFSCTLWTYMKILKYYRPDELPALVRKYVEDWRNPFLTVK
jgi:hypothetical protein